MAPRAGEPGDGEREPARSGAEQVPELVGGRALKAKLRRAIGKQAGDTVHIRIDERIG